MVVHVGEGVPFNIGPPVETSIEDYPVPHRGLANAFCMASQQSVNDLEDMMRAVHEQDGSPVSAAPSLRQQRSRAMGGDVTPTSPRGRRGGWDRSFSPTPCGRSRMSKLVQKTFNANAFVNASRDLLASHLPEIPKPVGGTEDAKGGNHSPNKRPSSMPRCFGAGRREDSESPETLNAVPRQRKLEPLKETLSEDNLLVGLIASESQSIQGASTSSACSLQELDAKHVGHCLSDRVELHQAPPLIPVGAIDMKRPGTTPVAPRGRQSAKSTDHGGLRSANSSVGRSRPSDKACAAPPRRRRSAPDGMCDEVCDAMVPAPPSGDKPSYRRRRPGSGVATTPDAAGVMLGA